MPRKPDQASERLRALKRAHASEAGASQSHTPRVEDYIEVIYELILEKGYARVVDIGAHLAVSPPTATKMIQRLDEVGLVVYERYRGIALTAEGEALAKHLRHRHGVLAEFLRLLGVDEATAHRDVEGIEHHLDPATLAKIAAFVEYARKNPEWFGKFKSER